MSSEIFFDVDAYSALGAHSHSNPIQIFFELADIVLATWACQKNGMSNHMCKILMSGLSLQHNLFSFVYANFDTFPSKRPRDAPETKPRPVIHQRYIP